MLRTIFFGTPDFAVPALAALVEAGYRPERVVTQPARPAGRGSKLRDPPVASWAREHGLEVRQPETVRQGEFMDEMRRIAPDVAAVVAFGQIFRRELLELPRHGCVNLHASLLPRYRGAAPIQAALAAGETVTGVTAMQMDTGLDSGPVLLRAELGIGRRETAAELFPRLAERGAALLVETLRRLEAGELVPEPQDHALATRAPRLTKTDAEVDWELDAGEIYNRWRGYTPWPGLVSRLGGTPLKLLAVEPLVGGALAGPAAPGTVLGLEDERLVVTCGGDTMLGLERVQRPGRKPVSAADFWNGERLEAGQSFDRA